MRLFRALATRYRISGERDPSACPFAPSNGITVETFHFTIISRIHKNQYASIACINALSATC